VNYRVCKPPPLEKRPLKDIGVSETEPVFAIYPDPVHFKNFVTDEFYEIFYQNMVKKIGWRVYSDDIARIDVLLILNIPHMFFSHPEPTLSMLERLKESGRVTHFAIFVDDIWSHNHMEYETKHRIYSVPFLNLIMACGSQFKVHFPDINKTVLWFPHAASSRFHQPVNVTAEPKIMLSGSITAPFYPYRIQAATLLKKGNKHLVRYRHPGYDLSPNSTLRSDFVSDIRSYASGLTSGLVMNGITAKHLEITALGQLLLTNHDIETHLSRLCFIRSKHYLAYSHKTMKGIVEIASRKDLIPRHLKMRQAAQSLVLSLHTTETRAQLMTKIALSLWRGDTAQGFYYEKEDAVPILNAAVAYWQKKLATKTCEVEELCEWKVVNEEYKKLHSSSGKRKNLKVAAFSVVFIILGVIGCICVTPRLKTTVSSAYYMIDIN